ncbi:MAG: ThiF family adenylyltransferase, partial [Desulfobacula sp.]|nr:ThiF family adenylyltransferase [Desulfobacula sp.]
MDIFARTEQLIGSHAMEKIKKARVAVFGLGAVGSFAVEALARSGIGYLRLVDFDRVDASNINRQLYALHSTIGRKKARLA